MLLTLGATVATLTIVTAILAGPAVLRCAGDRQGVLACVRGMLSERLNLPARIATPIPETPPRADAVTIAPVEPAPAAVAPETQPVDGPPADPSPPIADVPPVPPPLPQAETVEPVVTPPVAPAAEPEPVPPPAAAEAGPEARRPLAPVWEQHNTTSFAVLPPPDGGTITELPPPADAAAADFLMPDAAGAQAAPSDAPAAPGGPDSATIRRGDTLWGLARRHYGKGSRYWTIFHANRDRIVHPARIYPGQVLDLPLVYED